MRYRSARNPAALTSFASFNKANRKLYENKSSVVSVSNTQKIIVQVKHPSTRMCGMTSISDFQSLFIWHRLYQMTIPHPKIQNSKLL
jgi:hypothetical protein